MPLFYCLSYVLAAVVVNGGCSTFLAIWVLLVLVYPGIQPDSALRGNSISKGCACSTMLFTPCYLCSSLVDRVVVLGGRIKGLSFCCTMYLLSASIEPTVTCTSGETTLKDLCGSVFNFFVQCGPQSLLRIIVPTVIYTKKSYWQNRLQVRLS